MKFSLPAFIIFSLAASLSIANSIKFEPTTVTSAGGSSTEAMFAYLSVPERHAAPAGKQLRLAVWKLRCTSAQPAESPIVFLQGGPGGTSADTFNHPGMAATIDALRTHADAYLFDQRGCGKSEPSLATQLSIGASEDLWLSRENIEKRLDECAEQAIADLTASGVDLAAFNTVESADDVESLRQAIDASKVTLWGYSYGTHLAVSVMRRHAASIDRAILCGFEGPDATYKSPSDVQAQFQNVAKLCAADTTMAASVPDLVAMIRDGIAKLDATPAVVTAIDPKTKQKTQVKIGGDAYRIMLARLYLGRRKDIAFLPRVAYSVAHGDGTQLLWGVQRLSWAPLPITTFVVDAASGVSRERSAQIENEAKTALLGDAANFPLPELNDRVMHVPVLGDDFRAPLRSDVPVLLISGTLDGHTPVNRTEEARASFKHFTHVVIENAGHDDLVATPKLGATMLDFLRGRDVSGAKLSIEPLVFQPLNATK